LPLCKAPEVAIFRRFSVLNARNLLYFQAELVELEKALESKLDQCNADNSPDRSLDGMKNAKDVEKTLWQIFEEIRAKLKDYSKSSSQ
jgi:hypothetical protein